MDCGPRWEPSSGERAGVPGLDRETLVAELARLRSRVRELEKEVERLRGLLKAPESGLP